MVNLAERIDTIKESILKNVPAKCIYLFGSYAYGNPTEDSDIDIYVVTPDNISNFSEIYAKIIGDLGDKKIFFIDLLLGKKTIFLRKQSAKKGNFCMNNENDVSFAINSVEKVSLLKPIIDIRSEIDEET